MGVGGADCVVQVSQGVQAGFEELGGAGADAAPVGGGDG